MYDTQNVPRSTQCRSSMTKSRRWAVRAWPFQTGS